MVVLLAMTGEAEAGNHHSRAQARGYPGARRSRAAVPADDTWHNPSTWPAWRQLLPHVLVTTDAHRNLTGVEEEWFLELIVTWSGAPSPP